MNSELVLRVLLVGNYEYDRQESMQRFAALLSEELPGSGVEVECIRPEPVFGKLKPAPVGLGKWLGYIDKFLIFPLLLRARVRRMRRPHMEAVLVHICDHSNAFYCAMVEAPTIITCHDLLAVKGALGTDPNCPASRTGRILQKWILRGLQKSDFVVCDSEATRSDLLDLSEPERAGSSSVALLAQNYHYRQLSEDEADRRLALVPALRLDQPFILTVGSNLPRKNRDGILRIVARMGDAFSGQIVFAGEPLDDRLRQQAAELGVADRVVEAVKPSNEVLEALYSRAHALLYPSKCEGFGWPIIEAQACGCPVVCSDRTSVPEIAGEGAIVCDLDDESAFAAALLRLKDANVRQELVTKGFANLTRFSTHAMIQSYCDVYRRLQRARLGVNENRLVDVAV